MSFGFYGRRRIKRRVRRGYRSRSRRSKRYRLRRIGYRM